MLGIVHKEISDPRRASFWECGVLKYAAMKKMQHNNEDVFLCTILLFVQ